MTLPRSSPVGSRAHLLVLSLVCVLSVTCGGEVLDRVVQCHILILFYENGFRNFCWRFKKIE